MIKRTLTVADYFLIAANLLPVAGVLFWNWDPGEIFIIYCLETVIIGIFNLIKMAIAGAYQKQNLWYNQGKAIPMPAIFFMLFFIVHYGLFVAVQTGIFTQVSGIGRSNGFFDFFLHWPKYITENSSVLLLSFFISYGVKLVTEFILPRQYKTVPLMVLMFQPYMRIFIQQVTVLLGSIFLGFGAGIIFIIIFCLVKTWLEIIINYENLLGKAMKDLQSGKQ